VRDELFSRVKNKFSAKAPRVLFPEWQDQRVQEAVKFLLQKKICEKFFILGTREEFCSFKENSLFDEEEESLCFSLSSQNLEARVYNTLKASYLRREKKIDESRLQEKATSKLYQSVFLLAEKEVDCVVAGCSYTTREVIIAGLELLEKQEGLGAISSCFFMTRQENARQLAFQALYADCAVIINPGVQELVSIAESTLATWKNFSFLFSAKEPVLAFLSYATHNSASDGSVERVKQASALFAQRNPNVLVDGPLQFDAAFDISVRRIKVKNSNLKEEPANIYIFPDINAGNIAYKISQRLAGCQAYGPLLQGFSAAYSDLSRGASASDIAMVTCLKLLSLST